MIILILPILFHNAITDILLHTYKIHLEYNVLIWNNDSAFNQLSLTLLLLISM